MSLVKSEQNVNGLSSSEETVQRGWWLCICDGAEKLMNDHMVHSYHLTTSANAEVLEGCKESGEE